jgi:hypothetical protein
MGHLRGNLRRETKGGGGQAAKFHETAARDPLPPQDVIECFRHDWRSSSQNAFSGALADRAALAALVSKSCAKPQLAFELNSLREAIRKFPDVFGLQSFSGGCHSGNRSSTLELIASADHGIGARLRFLSTERVSAIVILNADLKKIKESVTFENC